MTQNNLRWNPTVHAIKRIKERCGIEETQAKAFVNQLMQNAKYITTNPNGTSVYKHDKRDIMMVVNPELNVVITIHSATQTKTGAPNEESTQVKSQSRITIDRISAAIKRELSRMTTQLRREIRKLTEQQAQLNVTAAELTLNKIRCKAPHTQALIQTRIDAIITQVDDLAQDIDAKLTQIKNAEREVSEVVGE